MKLDAMELGLIGLGKMGFNMATRLRQGGTLPTACWRSCVMRFGGDAVKKA
jgi:3-hydroxyisobutyrate dehydrogenase-like beta-hydroxyacid dehydrogenase